MVFGPLLRGQFVNGLELDELFIDSSIFDFSI